MFLMAMLVVMTAGVLHRNLKVMRKARTHKPALPTWPKKMEEMMCLHSNRGPHQGRFTPPIDSYVWHTHIRDLDDTFAEVTVLVEGPAASYTLLAQRHRLPRVVWFASNREGGVFQLYRIQEDGEELERVTHTGSNEMQPPSLRMAARPRSSPTAPAHAKSGRCR